MIAIQESVQLSQKPLHLRRSSFIFMESRLFNIIYVYFNTFSVQNFNNCPCLVLHQQGLLSGAECQKAALSIVFSDMISMKFHDCNHGGMQAVTVRYN